MADTKQIVYGILKFFQEQQSVGSLPDDAVESLEVATQCLESAFDVSLHDKNMEEKYSLPASFTEIFEAGLKVKGSAAPQITEEDKIEAEKFKTEGNDLMKQEKYEEAIECYTKAIQKDGRNAVYYSNRAAAKSKVSKHEEALQDCVKALAIDPKYSKAYGRKGFAHSALNQFKDAKMCFQKALELDPENESYKQNIEIANQKLIEASGPGGEATNPFAGMGGFGNMAGLEGLLSNPALMNMATTLMSDPNMQTMMSNFVSGSGGQAAPPAGMSNLMAGANVGGGAGGSDPQGIGNLLQAGQQLAQQMQESNPELVSQLREQMRGGGQNPAEKDEGDQV